MAPVRPPKGPASAYHRSPLTLADSFRRPEPASPPNGRAGRRALDRHLDAAARMAKHVTAQSVAGSAAWAMVMRGRLQALMLVAKRSFDALAGLARQATAALVARSRPWAISARDRLQ